MTNKFPFYRSGQMPITMTDNGVNNILDVDASLIEKGSGSITFEGDNNAVSIGRSMYNVGIRFNLKGGAAISVGDNLSARDLIVHATRGTALQIGRASSFNGAVSLSMHEPGMLTIGDGCLFASDVIVTISDMHSILDTGTGTRVNPAASICIGDRVWLGMRSIVLKGVSIGSGTVIGAGSVVTRDVPANCVAAGNPAQVIRRNATWDFRLL
jgi:acetyltransferase-like isoleucine patch superfamily enzyme